jgi:hypothetical protein
VHCSVMNFVGYDLKKWESGQGQSLIGAVSWSLVQ